jgi:N4-gp56 family major capsid protein
MALENFIPTIWSARLLANLQKALVYGQEGLVTREYEGEIRAIGDSVKINAIGPVTVFDYAKDTDITAPQVLAGAGEILTIDQGKAFNFAVDDVDQLQQMPKVMDAAMGEAAYALGDVTDQFIVATMVAGCAIANITGTVVINSATLAYENLVGLKQMLDEANVPSGGRWCVIPPWIHAYMLKDDRFVKTGSGQAEARLANGEVGQAAGFRILMSNNVPHTTGTLYKCVAGVQMACAFADQISKVEAFRPERRFSDAVKGLHLYGAKVVRPQALAVLVASKS